jgi:uncharacterized protein YdhG (YjbR/CyaY superfamily)
MPYKADSIDGYIDQLPDDRKVAISKLRQVINANLPKGFKEELNYGMPGWVVPHSAYPAGYHCDPSLPLPFLAIASQKNFVAVYHMGIYAEPALLDWFVGEYPKHVKTKLDMGKSCIRFKKMDVIPYDLIVELVTKMPADEWVALYEKKLKR